MDQVRKVSHWLCILAALNSGTAFARCNSTQVLQPDDTFPLTSGRMVFHSYLSYGDGSSNLYVHDFQLKATRQINDPRWNISDPMNAQFSPDGNSLVFMGRRDGDWNVFAWPLDSTSTPLNLTAGRGGSNEDPKFTHDGRQLVIKHDGQLEFGQLIWNGDEITGVSSWQSVVGSDGRGEASMPSVSPSGKYLMYAAAGAHSSIRRINLVTGSDDLLTRAPSGAHDYYPVVRDYSAVFFTRGSAGSGNDQIMMILPGANGDGAAALALNGCGTNNSDATPVDEDYLIFSSGRYDPPYGLMLGEIVGGRVWRLSADSVNLADGRQKLGASYAPGH